MYFVWFYREQYDFEAHMGTPGGQLLHVIYFLSCAPGNQQKGPGGAPKGSPRVAQGTQKGSCNSLNRPIGQSCQSAGRQIHARHSKHNDINQACWREGRRQVINIHISIHPYPGPRARPWTHGPPYGPGPIWAWPLCAWPIYIHYIYIYTHIMSYIT